MTLTPQIFRFLFGLALVICSYAFLKDVSELPSTWLPNDKIMHLLVFAILTLLWLLSFRGRYITGLLLLTLYGGLIELLQHYLTVRQGDWWDWLADLIGIVIALLCWQCRLGRFTRLRR